MKTTFVLTSVLLGSIFPASHTRNASFTHSGTLKSRSMAGNPVGAIYIVIDKSDYELSIYDEDGWWGTYPVVFGNNSLDDKKMERFVRIHRAALLNTDAIEEIHQWFGGRLRVSLKGAPASELIVARDRVRVLKERLGF